jgi:hypothetical protein
LGPGLEFPRGIAGSRTNFVSGQLIQQLVSPVKHANVRPKEFILRDTITVNILGLVQGWL